MNLYGYCGAGPVGSQDELGLVPEEAYFLNQELFDRQDAWGHSPGSRYSKDRNYYYTTTDGRTKMHWPGQDLPEDANWYGSFWPNEPELEESECERILSGASAAFGITRRPKFQLVKEWETMHQTESPLNSEGKSSVMNHVIPLADCGSDTAENIRPAGTLKEHIENHMRNGDFARWGARGRFPGYKGDPRK